MNNLKKLRLEFGLSTRELAELTNTTNPLISMIETGARNLTVKRLEQFSRFFQVTKDYLLGNSDNGIICTCYLGSGVVFETINEETYENYKFEIVVDRTKFKRTLTKKGYIAMQDDKSKKNSQAFADHYFNFMNSIDDDKSKIIIEALPQLSGSQKDIIINLISTWIKT